MENLFSLEKLENKCFLNVIIQTLSHLYTFKQLVYKYGKIKKSSILYEFYVLFEKIHNNEFIKNNGVDVYNYNNLLFELMNIDIMFLDTEQHDAHEAMIKIIDTINEQLIKNEIYEFENEFYGKYINNKVCKNCNILISKNFKESCLTLDIDSIDDIDAPITTNDIIDYMDIKFNIPNIIISTDEKLTMINSLKSETKKAMFNEILKSLSNSYSIKSTDAIIDYFNFKYIDNYTCINCNHLNEKLENINIIDQFPKVLITHYQRINMNGKKKINPIIPEHLIFHPQNIPYLNLKNKVTYNIRSIICHKGEYLDFGHYYMFYYMNNAWYLINDDEIIKINYDFIKTDAIYMIIYEMT